MLLILITGLGSMGKRRIRNLQRISSHKIIGFDTRKDRREETTKKYNIETFDDIRAALKRKPDLMIISTPPDLHYKYAIIAIKNNIHFYNCLDEIKKLH